MRNSWKNTATVAWSLFCSSEAFVKAPSWRERSLSAHDASSNRLATNPFETLNSFGLGSLERSVLLHSLESSSTALSAAVTSTPSVDKDASTETTKNESSDAPIAGNVVFLVPSQNADTVLTKFGTKSPVDCPSVVDAATHLANKTRWFSDKTIEASVMAIPTDQQELESLKTQLLEVDALIALGLSSESDIEFCTSVFQARQERESSLKSRQCQFAIECTPTSNLPSTVSCYDESNPSLLTKFPWTKSASALRMHDQMTQLFERWTSDDFTVALMLFFNQYSGTEIDWVKHSIDATWEKGPVKNTREVFAMATKCGDCIVDCLKDENCKTCLNALTEVDTRDQVMSYRTIVSYESDLLRDFSLCILQKNNVFECDATIPTIPQVTPISTWRDKPLTYETARSILIGHLDEDGAPEGGWKKDVSWEVACGANVAYDQFPSQNQIFYESVNGKDMWYDPVFRVETIDGRSVWCKRHYRVRDGPVPGTFRFSVLDNGITSNEFWTIAGVANDLSWIVFHYAGAAGAVGQRYLGGLLCTPDGALPAKEKREEIWNVMRGAGIEPWELYVVDNDPSAPGAIAAGAPPLSYFLDDVRAAKRKRHASKQE